MEFSSLCYHYIKNAHTAAKYPRILGNPEEAFRAHLTKLAEEYEFISLDDIRAAYYGKPRTLSKRGLFISFDDGLEDHYRAAKILDEFGIKGTFFIPTCVLKDREPANPQVIHYILATKGVDAFLEEYARILMERGMDDSAFRVTRERGEDPYAAIARIKKAFKYALPQDAARAILLELFKRLLVAENPTIMDDIHITESQVREMLANGHSIGVHSHTHISVAASSLDDAGFEAEIRAPRRYLAETFDTSVDTFSYPFGEKQDCLASEELLRATNEYRLAFTVETVVNHSGTSPFELGRYMPMSKDSADDVSRILSAMSLSS